MELSKSSEIAWVYWLLYASAGANRSLHGKECVSEVKGATLHGSYGGFEGGHYISHILG